MQVNKLIRESCLSELFKIRSNKKVRMKYKLIIYNMHMSFNILHPKIQIIIIRKP